MSHTINPSKLAPDGGVTKAPSTTARSRTSLVVPIGTAITPALFNTNPRESIQRQPNYDVDDEVLQLVCGPQDILRPKRGTPQERCFFSSKHPEYVAYNLRTALDQDVQQNAHSNRPKAGGVGEDIVFATNVDNTEEIQQGKQTTQPGKTEVGYRASKAAFVDLTTSGSTTTKTAEGEQNYQNEFELGYAAYEAGDYQTAFKYFDPIKPNCLVAAYLVALMLYDQKVKPNGEIPPEQQAVDLMFDIYIRASANDAASNSSSVGNREIKHAACYLLGIAHETGVGSGHSIVARNDDCAMKWWRDAACDLIQLPRHHNGEDSNSDKCQQNLGKENVNSGEQNRSSSKRPTVADKLAEDDMYQPPILTDFGVLCQVKLAKYYYSHDDEKSATFWFRQAAHNGHLESQATLGMILYLQQDKNEQKDGDALRWLKEAAESGSLNASAMLAAIYFDKRMFDMCIRWAVDAVNFAFENAAIKNDEDKLNSWQNLARKCDSTISALKNCVASSLCYYSFCLRHGLGSAGGGIKQQVNNKDVDKADECAKLAMQLDPAQTRRIMQFVH